MSVCVRLAVCVACIRVCCGFVCVFFLLAPFSCASESHVCVAACRLREWKIFHLLNVNRSGILSACHILFNVKSHVYRNFVVCALERTAAAKKRFIGIATARQQQQHLYYGKITGNIWRTGQVERDTDKCFWRRLRQPAPNAIVKWESEFDERCVSYNNKYINEAYTEWCYGIISHYLMDEQRHS